ncbi:MAG: sel1 repeat family protein [Gammaproteobacteria bacterium]|nr:MAG: sel1 repeat family protein [Gammaproteobacteria bacterium]
MYRLAALFLSFLLIGGCSPSFEEGVTAYTIGDYPKAFRIIKEYAEKGDPEAQNYLGNLYSRGQGVEKNLELAAEWYQKAANQGHADAQNNLGIAYSRGLGVAKDGVYAMALFRQAAEKGHIDAQNNLGGILITGQGVERNIPEAIRWFKKAAAKNSAKAQFNLGLIYSNGMGVRRDIQQGVAWLQKAANQGHLGALNSLAWIYATCSDERYCDGKKAVDLAEQAVTKLQHPQFFDTLAAAYARMNRFDDAIEYQKKAMKMVPNNPRLLREFEYRLATYQKHIPWPPVEKPGNKQKKP